MITLLSRILSQFITLYLSLFILIGSAFGANSEDIREMAKLGEPDAQYQLGILYSLGERSALDDQLRDAIDEKLEALNEMDELTDSIRSSLFSNIDNNRARPDLNLADFVRNPIEYANSYSDRIDADINIRSDLERLSLVAQVQKMQMGFIDQKIDMLTLRKSFVNSFEIENNSEAAKWFSLAAEQGHMPAQYRMGEIYSSGKGVDENLNTAYMWYLLAELSGNSDAKVKKQEIERLLPAQTIRQANALVYMKASAH